MSISIDKLQPGELIIYYEGMSLARGRNTTAYKPDPQLAAADAAWEAALAGRVDLLQRHTGDGTIEYVVIRRRAIDRRPVLPHYREIEVGRRAA
jgi:hypothetical protein